jgi:hypothetical protein
MQPVSTGKHTPRKRGGSWSAVALALFLLPFAGASPSAADTKNTCVECHSNPDFLVTANKLYDYFQEWEKSIHSQEDVTCDDCHGGNPEAADKKAAHGVEVAGGLTAGSAVSFENIPATCGECHVDIYEGYRESDHADHLREKKQEKQGPNCVTCHGSINVTVLNMGTVKKTCEQCHNAETGNHPDLPAQASDILNRLLAIQRYYRFVGRRGDPEEVRAFFGVMDQRISDLSVIWHTFDLPKIDKETRFVLDLLKTKRAEIRAREKSAKP